MHICYLSKSTRFSCGVSRSWDVVFVYFEISKYCQIDLRNNSYSDERVQVLLMSGMSNGAFTDICSLRSAEERIVHWNNVLKFAVFKKDHALITIGGPWSAAIDGGDPLIDCSCLVRTAIRYVIIQYTDPFVNWQLC